MFDDVEREATSEKSPEQEVSRQSQKHKPKETAPATTTTTTTTSGRSTPVKSFSSNDVLDDMQDKDFLHALPPPLLNDEPTVTVHDLFYNLPIRQRKSANNAILHCVQAYAICVAERGIGLICQKKKQISAKATTSKKAMSSRNNVPATTTDWNSSMGSVTKLHTFLQNKTSFPANDARKLHELQQHATKNVIAMIYGSRIQSHLQPFSWTAPRQASHDDILTCLLLLLLLLHQPPPLLHHGCISARDI